VNFLNLSPNKKEYFQGRGFVNFLKKLNDKAIADFNRVIEIDSNDAVAYFGLYEIYSKNNQNSEALANINKVNGLMFNFNSLDPASFEYKILKNNLLDVIYYYKKAIELEPKNIDFMVSIAYWYQLLEDYNHAILYYEKILNNYPNFASAYGNMGYCYLGSNEFLKSLQMFKQATKLEEKNIDAIIGISLTYYYQNDMVNATKYMNQAKNIRPELIEGISGFEKLKKDGLFYNQKDDAAIKRMLEQFR